ncbi:MAG TPA: excinuclease ABC subunit UvrB, partial [Bdellovibrionota bacterium]|nr:excinuclease ABC subunit UvrB [Bdellovibrionota bacterium]
YEGMLVYLEQGREYPRQEMHKKLVEIQNKPNAVDFHRGTFRVRGEVVEIFPAYEEERAIRVEFFGDEIESIHEVDPLRGIKLQKLPRVTLYPASHYVTTLDRRKRAIETIRVELRERLAELNANMRLLEAQRLSQRTLFDLEMLEELGYCQGIENYSRHLTGRNPGDPPPTLLDYFPKDWLLIVDESHVTVPQIGGMYRGDRARKSTLVEHGFRMPSALDNRPLSFEEWEKMVNQAVFVSATPGEWELKQAGGEVVEQLIRPTGLLDPIVEVRPATKQVDDLLGEIRIRVERKERVLVTTLTKKLAEDLTRYYVQQGIKVKYLHSDIETLERVEILRDLRLGTFDVLVGINLLREGLDLPEVTLVAILDADKEGFLRSARSLIQTIGRAARNSAGTAILYADTVTDSMKQAIEETARRRKAQGEYNALHGITPQTIVKAVRDNIAPLDSEEDPQDRAAMAKRVLGTGRGSGHGRGVWTAAESAAAMGELDRMDREEVLEEIKSLAGDDFTSFESLDQTVSKMGARMKSAARDLDFEKAADLRDRLQKLKQLKLMI